jgi:hypothetical protein
MQAQVRVRDKDSLAQFLGWFSIGLGVAEIVAPRLLSRIVGAKPDGVAPGVVRAMGVREVSQGTGILTRPRPTGWLWSRVAGDALDLSLLALTAVKNRRARTLFAVANVAAVTVPDIYESRFMGARRGPVRSARLMRKGVTIYRPRSEVEAAWSVQTVLARKLDDAGASVRFADAPGDRGTELIVELLYDPPAGDIGAAVQKLTGRDLGTQLSDDLRRFKQQVESGQIVRSDGAPDGHQLATHLRQRAAPSLEEAIR